MKKVITATMIAILLTALVLSAALVLADKPAEPGKKGQTISEGAQEYPGQRADNVSYWKEIMKEKNFGQFQKANKDYYVLPPKHWFGCL
jgi:hypothetical protein